MNALVVDKGKGGAEEGGYTYFFLSGRRCAPLPRILCVCEGQCAGQPIPFARGSQVSQVKSLLLAASSSSYSSDQQKRDDPGQSREGSRSARREKRHQMRDDRRPTRFSRSTV